MTHTVSSADIAEASWFKSSYSDLQGERDCVRIATNLPAIVLIGDTKTPDAHLAVSPHAWSAFAAAVVTGGLS
jgi:hypothetical protein